MEIRIFEIIVSRNQNDLIKKIEMDSNHVNEFLIKHDYKIDTEEVKRKFPQLKLNFYRSSEVYGVSIKNIIRSLESCKDLYPEDIFVLSDELDLFVFEGEKWSSILSSEPICLVFKDQGVYSRGPIVFNYSHFLNKQNFSTWVTNESSKLNPQQIALLKSERIIRTEEKREKKLFDCFVFNNEFDILELRLKLLNDKVEKFVLVESKQTHSGKSKPAYFQQNKELFQEYSDKIIHIVIDKFPEEMLYMPSEIDVSEELHIHWFRENFQRNEILKGLYKLNLHDEDIILISDLDEIPDPEKLDSFVENLPDDDFGFQLQKWCIWDFDRYHMGLWPGTAGVKWKTLIHTTPQEIRKNRYSDYKFHTNEAYGWHCSWFGGIDAVMDKLRSFAHQELSQISRDDVERKMTMNLDIHGHQLIYDKEGYRPLI